MSVVYGHRFANDEPHATPFVATEGVVLEREQAKLKVPSLYKVMMHNDDYTPMQFVVEVLERFFGLNREAAMQIMLTVHTQGKAVCGLFTRDIAETKAMQVNDCAREHQHPLLCDIEQDI